MGQVIWMIVIVQKFEFLHFLKILIHMVLQDKQCHIRHVCDKGVMISICSLHGDKLVATV